MLCFEAQAFRVEGLGFRVEVWGLTGLRFEGVGRGLDLQSPL